ncbi:unnamed protein product [Phytophthora lilii]|uniref:Unnamed protein product n=1 Tax=Phytophthora lilii TaxID=2077276 RepID=A0A9W6TE75_9STRA|nr:unnamed protein product [Phytophthora lilii]
MAKAKVSSEELKRRIKRPKARHEAAAGQTPAASRSVASAVAPPKLQSPSPSSRGALCRIICVFAEEKGAGCESDGGSGGCCRVEAIAGESIRQLAGAVDQEVRGADPSCAVQGFGSEHSGRVAWRPGGWSGAWGGYVLVLTVLCLVETAGPTGGADSYQGMDHLRQNISDLRQEELKYDQHIKMVSQNIRRLYEEEAFDKGSFDNFCYVTHDDMRRQESFADQSVMAIKAPPGTTLEVPDPDEGMPAGKRRFQIFLKSTGEQSLFFKPNVSSCQYGVSSFF